MFESFRNSPESLVEGGLISWPFEQILREHFNFGAAMLPFWSRLSKLAMSQSRAEDRDGKMASRRVRL